MILQGYIRRSNFARRVAHNRLWCDTKALKQVYKTNLDSRANGLTIFRLINVLPMAKLI